MFVIPLSYPHMSYPHLFQWMTMGGCITIASAIMAKCDKFFDFKFYVKYSETTTKTEKI